MNSVDDMVKERNGAKSIHGIRKRQIQRIKLNITE